MTRFLHPGRLTWNLQITHLERKMIFQTSMIMFHVNLPGCIFNPIASPQKKKNSPCRHMHSFPLHGVDCPQRQHGNDISVGNFIMYYKSLTWRFRPFWEDSLTFHHRETGDDSRLEGKEILAWHFSRPASFVAQSTTMHGHSIPIFMPSWPTFRSCLFA